eukprot:CAMPEP_0194264768 /NCGR_PEP_ID=MMETSP0169-20130528/108_1 /TAXON_ID=218684 /ORGANISM="Corethron pennatum, Strain L29A3" /LENGTH=82 /DNA_ID=CAMNT_0039005041 /DNA_START=54 /DNA_END=298 /DNA_ORIENTATION=-
MTPSPLLPPLPPLPAHRTSRRFTYSPTAPPCVSSPALTPPSPSPLAPHPHDHNLLCSSHHGAPPFYRRSTRSPRIEPPAALP